MADIDTGEGSNSDCEGVDRFGDLKAVTPERPGSKSFDLFQPIIGFIIDGMLFACSITTFLGSVWELIVALSDFDSLSCLCTC